MANLQKIIAASKRGYSALVTYGKWKDESKIVEINEFIGSIHLQNGDEINISDAEDEIISINEFVFVGHLFGKPVIPDKQKFRVKKDGAIVTYDLKTNGLEEMFLNCKLESGWNEPFYPTELEPVFE